MPSAHSFKQWLVRRLYPYDSIRRVLKGPVRGAKYYVRPSMGLTYALGNDSSHFQFLSGKVQPGMTVYDIGANKGQITLLFAQCVGPQGKVYAFEPSPIDFGWLTKNVQLNRLDQVSPQCCALSDSDGNATFTYHPDKSTQGGLEIGHSDYRNLNPTANAYTVETRTLDRFIATGAAVPDVMKIDVEGAAAVVLAGGRTLFEQHAPKIYIELHGPTEQVGVRDELLTRGYVCETLDGVRVADPTSGWFSPLWCYKA